MAIKYDEKVGKQIEMLVSLGLTHEQIGYIVSLSPKTLRKHYKKELANGKSKIDAAIGGQLVKKAIGGDITSIIFYLKTKCHWKETSVVETQQLPRLNTKKNKLPE